MTKEIKIRPVTADDAEQLLQIYAPYVLTTPITFEYEVPSLHDFKERIKTISSRYPYLVAISDKQIVGYCYASCFKPRTAYDWSVETSIYLDSSLRGQGIGSKLYKQLEQILLQQNICNVCACITFPNPESISFHERFGYKEVAHFTKSGYKFGKWHDMIWMEKSICDHPVTPAPFIPISNL